MTQSYFLKTARLGFRQWTEDDLLLAMAIWGNARVTTSVGRPFSPAWITTWRRFEEGAGRDAVFLRSIEEHQTRLRTGANGYAV
jgi:hypothetical protein